MPNEKNKELVKTLKDKFSKAKSVVFTDYIGIKSQDANVLRQKIKESDAEMFVAKNTLIKVAMQENKSKSMSEAEKDLEGSTAVVFSFSDPIAPIKAIFEFTKKLEFPKIKSAIIDGHYMSADRIAVIKNLPSKEQLLGQVVSGLKSPLSGFVGVIGGVQRKFVYAINAIAQKKAVINNV